MNLSSFVFGTKGETLEDLRTRCSQAIVLPLHLLTVGEWRAAPEKVLAALEAEDFRGRPLVVRSSALSEDECGNSKAGAYKTFLRVQGREAIIDAIEKVIASYGSDDDANQVLIQPELENVATSGVAFSFDPNLGSPYYVICFESEKGNTTAVTSGSSEGLRTVVCLKGDEHRLPPSLQSVGALLAELEEITGQKNLDVEFGIDTHGKLHLFQCRPLLADRETTPEILRGHLDQVSRKARELQKKHPYLLGATTLFGVMPDWNPAEIIGLRPRPLALSLYREIITSSIWAYQRDNYGYRNLRSFPLLVDFCGLPYIDVRVSFNSFIPKTISDELGAKLVDFYLQTLAAAPALHDKVEFDIVLTCYTPDIERRLARLAHNGFSVEECDSLRTALRELTRQIMDPKTGLWTKDLHKIEELERRMPLILNSDLDTISRIYWLIEDCKRYGTLPFAGLARAGFVAVQMLRSLVSEGVFTAKDYDAFFQSLDTVSSRISRDLATLSKADFLARYGHLRPGTYDIRSVRYDEDPDRYFSWGDAATPPPAAAEPFVLDAAKSAALEALLEKHALPYSPPDFLHFIKSAIEGREYSKFVFTRALSDCLSLIRNLGKEHGLDADATSYAEIQTLLNLYSNSDDIGHALHEDIASGRARYAISSKLRLPPLIAKPDDVYCFEIPTSLPNFITRKRITGRTTELSGRDNDDMRGAIVFIPSADPGYDWIFSKGIAGLVTMFGGANSHMAIRAGELGIAAVIGAGEDLYTQWRESDHLELDCENHKVQTVQ